MPAMDVIAMKPDEAARPDAEGRGGRIDARPSPAGTLSIVYDVAYPFVEGGGQRRIYEVAHRLAQQGWAVRWYTFKTWEGAPEVERDGIRFIGLPGYVPLYGADGRRSTREPLVFGHAVWMCRKAIADADIVWCGQWPYLHLLSFMHQRRCHLVVDWWETWGFGWLRYGKWPAGLAGMCLEWVLANVCSRVGTVIAISQMGATDLDRVGARSGNIEVIPNGFDLGRIAQPLEGSGKIDVLYVGRLQPHKNVAHILHALRFIRDRHGILYRAVIAGDGPERAALEVLAKDGDLESQLAMPGSVSDDEKFALMARSRLFVHPSTKEGGGSITVVEAQASGTPVLIYDASGGIDPGYVDGKNIGWLVKPVGPEALAEKMYDVLGVPGGQKPGSSEACKQFANEFRWDKIAGRYDRIFRAKSSRVHVR